MSSRILLPGTPLAEAFVPRNGYELPPHGPRTAGLPHGSTVTAFTSAHVKGSITTLASALLADSFGLYVATVGVVGSAGVTTGVLLDVMIGGSGSEVVIAPNVNFGDSQAGRAFFIPYFFPSGSRVSGQIQSSVASKGLTIRLALATRQPGVMLTRSPLVDFGTDLDTSLGTVLDTPSGDNVYSDWTEIIDATPEAYRGLIVGVGGGGQAAMTSASSVIEIGIGASGQEQRLIRSIGVQIFSTEIMQQHVTGPFPCLVPKGSRLTARWAASAISGNAVDVSLLGLR